MMNVKIFVLVLSALYLSSATAEPSNIWADIAKQDLDHIYQTVKENHPGYIDEDNPYFKIWLEEGYEKGLKELQQVSSLTDVMSLVKTYVAGFADGHFGLSFNYQPRYKKWTGLIMEKQGNDYVVQFADDNWITKLPETSSKLISCDGRNVDQIMSEDILIFRFNNQQLNHPKVSYALNIFVDDGIGKRQYFKHCEFEKEGKSQSFDIKWDNIRATKLAVKTNLNIETRKFEINELEINNYWVNLPKFYPDAKEQKELKKVIEQLKTVSQSASIIVLDVRGNGGGNSQWGVEVAKALYGESYINKFREINPDNSFAMWRTSTDNYQHLNKLLKRIESQFGEESNIFIDFSSITQRMKKALDNGNHFVRQGEIDSENISISMIDIPFTTKTNVVFLTDESCASACLDFADLILKLPNVTHMGQETGADTVYMDIRMLDLPSGLGRYSLAQKVYRNRLRKHNESYVPEQLFNGNINNTKKVQIWLLHQMKKS